MPELQVSWSEYHQKIEILAAKIYQSGWDFNQVICIAKGGLRVGDLLARIFNQPLAILYASSYGGKENRVRGEIRFAKHLLTLGDTIGSKVLLVDDLVDSGVSLQQSVVWLENNYSDQITDLKTAVIWWKQVSVFQPDYHVDYLPDNPWIHQPFEYYEKITPGALAEIHKAI